MRGFKYLFTLFIVTTIMFVCQAEVFAATATVDTSEIHQTIEGFGVSLAWEIYQLYNHPAKNNIYNYLFKELGLDILRLRNVYRKSEDYIFPLYGEIVDSFYSYSENDPCVMISSWSPPADLKSNGSLTNGGTLDTTATGEYVYGDFAEYWVDALNEFSTFGIEPKYISIQNEPSYTATWESCRFAPTENSTMAGYDQAFDSVYNRIQSLPSPPKMLAAEVHGIGYNTFQNFAYEFNNNAYIDGYCYHLYHGDGELYNTNPDAFNGNLSAIASGYSDKPIFQTEYDRGGWFNTIWLMHNCLVHGNVSGYLYWKSVWGTGTEPFIRLGGSIFWINHIYWAFRQYSKAIHYGWKRVGADFNPVVDSLRISAFIDSAANEMSIVILNVSHDDDSVDLDIPDFDIYGANILRTSDVDSCALVSYYDGSTIGLPARSITTISTLGISSGGAGVEDEDNNDLKTGDFSLAQNYPNPFNMSTTIEYSISEANFVKLEIFDVIGREIMTLDEGRMPAGNHSVNFDGNNLSAGVYFYRIKVGDNSSQLQRMILIR